MKLKLEETSGTTVLSISEGINSQQLAVLKAGINKLFLSEKKQILLDLTQMKESSVTAGTLLEDISALMQWAQESGAQLVIVSDFEAGKKLGHFKTREEAMVTFQPASVRMATLESKLQAQLGALEAQKNQIAEKINSSGSGEADIKTLRQENSTLKKKITSAEEIIRRYLKTRSDPYTSETLKRKRETVVQVLTSILEQDGSLTLK